MKKEASRNKLQKSAGELAGPDQKLELGMAMVRALPPFLRRDTAQKLVGERGYRTLRQILAPLEPMPKEESCKLVVIADSLIDKWAEEWERHYHDEYGLIVDFSTVRVPIYRQEKDLGQGFGWLIFVAQGLTCNQVFAKCESLFPSSYWTSEDLDTAVLGRNDREPTDDHYAIWLRDRVEPDEELTGFSANHLAAYGIPGNTLLEGLLLEPWYFKRTSGEHLNVVDRNLCCGSRRADGHVPNVCWRGDKFRVDYCNPDNATGHLRARSVVS